MFKQHPSWLYTWTSPDGNTQNQIDYISIAQRWKTRLMNCRTYPGADCDTDHQLLVATLKVRLGKRQRQWCLWISRNFRKTKQYRLVQPCVNGDWLCQWEMAIFETIETIKRSSWVDPIGAQQIQDGGGRHLEKKQKSRYLRTVWPIFTKFGMLMQNGSLRPLKNLNFTNRRWRTAAILKPLHHPISATFWLTLIKYGTVIHAGPQSLA